MKENISKRDWETISAYLDGQLSERKRIRFESRLDHDQQLRVALDELRDTRHVLRNAPRLRAPRSFMLSPELAGQPRRLPNFAPVFGWASAVASFLFVLFMIGDLFSTGGAIPMVLNNIPIQEDFIVSIGQAVEDEILSQPEVNTSKMEEPSPQSAEAAALEISEGDAASEVAAAPVEAATTEIESAPKEELTPMTKASDTTTAEDADVEPEVATPGAAAEAGIAFSTESEAVEEEQEAGKPDVNAQVASVSETPKVESTPEQHLLAPPVVETEPPAAEVQPVDEVQPQEAAAVAQPSAAMTLPAEVPTEPSPTLMAVSISTEIPLASAPVDNQRGSLVIGIEVILGLLALGAGIAWVYLRRRGG